MLDLNITEEGLALILQASREFAFEQIANGMPLLPYATCVKPDGDMNFVRFAEPGTDLSPDEVLELTEKEVRQEVEGGGLVAVGIVSGVRLDNPEDGMADAVRIKVESQGFAREFLALYQILPGEQGEQPKFSPGKLVPFEVEPVIFSK